MIIIIIMIIARVFSFTSRIGPRVHWTQMECCWKWTLYISWGTLRNMILLQCPIMGGGVVETAMVSVRQLDSKLGFTIYYLFYLGFLFFFAILCGMWNFSDQESNPSSKWKHGVLNTGPPGKTWTVLLTTLGLNSFICQVRITNLS